jgi:hypothetical protein
VRTLVSALHAIKPRAIAINTTCAMNNAIYLHAIKPLNVIRAELIVTSTTNDSNHLITSSRHKSRMSQHLSGCTFAMGLEHAHCFL